MIVGDLFSIEMSGLRDALGRYASMANGGVSRVALTRGKLLAEEVEKVFRHAAPESGRTIKRRYLQTFQDSIYADFEASGGGGTIGHFDIEVDTTQGDVADFLRAGSFEISSGDKALQWFDRWGAEHIVPVGQQPVLWFTRHRDWEEEAEAEAAILIDATGRSIAGEVSYELTYGEGR